MPAPILYADPCFLQHETGDHPESPERLRFLYEFLQTRPVLPRFRLGEFRPASHGQLERVHPPGHIRHVQELALRGGGRLDADTVVSRGSYAAACHAAGAAIAAVDAVLTDDARRALCLIRPPGHHALADRGMGFCLFNNVALAARHALDEHRLQRVLIVDWDVHHGNGTQEIFYETDAVYFFSSHRFPFYPGTGDADETGSGDGVGATFNLPLAFGVSRSEFLTRFQTTLEFAAAKCRPELVLVSAGFDAHQADPIGSLGLETEDFERLTKLAVEIAEAYCGGRLVSLLEGGYNIRALADSVECHMTALAAGA